MTERLRISESEYRGLQLPSYSLLKRIEESGHRALKYNKKYDSEAMDFGSLLDCKLLCPEEFNNKFYFDATKKPTEQLLDLADEVIKIRESGDSYANDHLGILAVADNLNLFGGTKDVAKRIAKFDNELFWNYLEAKEDAAGKTVFTPDTLSECNEAVMILKTHPNTAMFFNKPQLGIEIIPQLMLTSEISGVTVKIMMDICIIDHINKTVTPYDLKTMDYKSQYFKSNFIKFKYYLQGALYKEVLFHWLQDYLIDPHTYTLEDFKFIVYSRQDKYPSIWNMGLEWHKKGLYGFENIFGEKEKGIYELLDDYMFYSRNPDIEVDRKFIENKILEL